MVWFRAISSFCTLVIFPTQLQMLRLAGQREEWKIWRRKGSRYPRLEVMQSQAFIKDGSLPAPPHMGWRFESGKQLLMSCAASQAMEFVPVAHHSQRWRKTLNAETQLSDGVRTINREQSHPGESSLTTRLHLTPDNDSWAPVTPTGMMSTIFLGKH